MFIFYVRVRLLGPNQGRRVDISSDSDSDSGPKKSTPTLTSTLTLIPTLTPATTPTYTYFVTNHLTARGTDQPVSGDIMFARSRRVEWCLLRSYPSSHSDVTHVPEGAKSETPVGFGVSRILSTPTPMSTPAKTADSDRLRLRSTDPGTLSPAPLTPRIQSI